MKQRKALIPIIAMCICLAAGCSGNTQTAGTTTAAETTTTSALSETAETTAGTTTAAATEITEEQTAEVQPVTNLEKLDMTKWQYNADDDVYYQIGISYCETPADTSYETLAVFVPGAYMTATDNGDGTYTCELSDGTINGYTAETAPIVMPINTPGYSAMAALTDYSSSVKTYTSEGFVYVHAGCRGRDAGAPAGVTDLKAAVRYVRYCDDVIAGSAERIFTFGMSGGGAQSALMGATGDSELYTPYLEAIGAVRGVSDAVYGSMDWCPITNLDSADEAYEWMMGVTRSGLSDDEQAISDALAAAFAEYINSAQIKDENGNILTLEESSEGTYQSGSYYDYLKGVIEQSLNNFLSDTTFPYDASSSSGGGHGGMGGAGPNGGGQRPDRDFGGEKPDGAPGGDFGGGMPDGEMPGDMGGNGDKAIEDVDNITRNATSSGISLSGTYETAQDYIDALNADGEWVTYDADTNTATISSVADFVKAFKSASKNLGAFDQLDGGQGENTLFGYGDGSGAHFDSTLAQILSDLGSEYAESYAADLAKTDSAGYTAEQRLQMYTPLYYLLESSEGYGTSTVAKYWRIRTGIAQSDTAVTTEMNLALALENYDSVESVDFETIWGAGHTEAERTGNSTENFITWVNECMK
ncbi:MAG: tannase [Ruminiclostridium sp.]|nr:tannase [Ruminiclostridium sp.]